MVRILIFLPTHNEIGVNENKTTKITDVQTTNQLNIQHRIQYWLHIYFNMSYFFDNDMLYTVGTSNSKYLFNNFSFYSYSCTGFSLRHECFNVFILCIYVIKIFVEQSTLSKFYLNRYHKTIIYMIVIIKEKDIRNTRRGVNTQHATT